MCNFTFNEICKKIKHIIKKNYIKIKQIAM